jgi:1-acyl-sn-glycerol-3-phosphate acyltransferase
MSAQPVDAGDRISPKGTAGRADAAQPPGDGTGLAIQGPDPSALVVFLYNVFYWPYLLSTCALLFPPAFVIFLGTFFWDRHLQILHRYTTWWGAHYLTRAPLVPWAVEGKEHLRPGVPYVYVSNHQSMVDILAVFATELSFKWVSKVENFFVPFIGWNMILNRYISLRRGHKPSIIRMYKRCNEWLGAGISVFMFPEGTRSPDGEMKEFFQGAFKISVSNKVPIVPILIEGTGKILPKGRFRIMPYPVTVRILPPIDPASVDLDADRLHDVVRAQMIDEQNRMRGRSNGSGPAPSSSI